MSLITESRVLSDLSLLFYVQVVGAHKAAEYFSDQGYGGIVHAYLYLHTFVIQGESTRTLFNFQNETSILFDMAFE